MIGDTIINGEKASIILIKNLKSSNTCYSKVYYSNREDDLFAVAYTEPCAQIAWFKGNDLPISSIIFSPDPALKGTDSVNIVKTPLHLLKHPMVEGDKWRSYEYGSQIHYSRKWISLDTVTTDWGEIECMKLQIQNNSNVISWPTIRQYFSNKGLIKEESFTKQTTLNGDTIFVSQETILKEVNF